jgi:hypothetical protein
MFPKVNRDLRNIIFHTMDELVAKFNDALIQHMASEGEILQNWPILMKAHARVFTATFFENPDHMTPIRPMPSVRGYSTDEVIEAFIDVSTSRLLDSLNCHIQTVGGSVSVNMSSRGDGTE